MPALTCVGGPLDRQTYNCHSGLRHGQSIEIVLHGCMPSLNDLEAVPEAIAFETATYFYVEWSFYENDGSPHTVVSYLRHYSISQAQALDMFVSGYSEI